jgi:uncharacterized protein (TIGR00288 family)
MNATALQFAILLDGHFVIHKLKPRLGSFPSGELTAATQRELQKYMRPLCASDFEPRFEQKGVDMRIGLDIARLALCNRIHAVVVVTGDSDFVPALKFARREGVRVYLDTMGHGVRRELKVHADHVINAALPP